MKKSEKDKGPPTGMLPGLGSTFALPKKNVGKATKTNKGKDSAADKDDEETTTVKKAPEVRPENVDTNGVAAKGKKGKKAGKKDAVVENLIEAVLVAKVVEPETPVPEIEHEESAPVAESKGKKGRGKKAAAKKDAVEEAIVSAEPEIPEDVKETKKGRSKRPSKREANEEKHEEVENNHPVEVEAPIAEIKEKKGRGKKAQPPAKAEEINSLHEDIPEPVAEENAVEVTAGPKPKTGPKSKVLFNTKMSFMSDVGNSSGGKLKQQLPPPKTAPHWSPAETDRFYVALQKVGTNFDAMEKMFENHEPTRDRKSLHKKFKKEEKSNLDKIDETLIKHATSRS